MRALLKAGVVAGLASAALPQYQMAGALAFALWYVIEIAL